MQAPHHFHRRTTQLTKRIATISRAFEPSTINAPLIKIPNNGILNLLPRLGGRRRRGAQSPRRLVACQGSRTKGRTACCSSSVLFSSVPILSRCFSCMALNCRDMSALQDQGRACRVRLREKRAHKTSNTANARLRGVCAETRAQTSGWPLTNPNQEASSCVFTLADLALGCVHKTSGLPSTCAHGHSVFFGALVVCKKAKRVRGVVPNATINPVGPSSGQKSKAWWASEACGGERGTSALCWAGTNKPQNRALLVHRLFVYSARRVPASIVNRLRSGV